MTFSVLACDQRSPAWFAARAGLLTASSATAMLSTPKKNGEETAAKSELRLRLALESLRGVPLEEDAYENKWMRQGREREAAALDAYEAASAEIVERVGFLRHDTLPMGCSPDGLIGSVIGGFEGGVEVKAPKFTTHYEYIRKNTVPYEYQPQIWHSLYVTGLPWWDFCSYCPEMPGAARLFRVRVIRDESVMDAYALAFSLFWSEVESVKDTLRALSAPEMACG